MNGLGFPSTSATCSCRTAAGPGGIDDKRWRFLVLEEAHGGEWSRFDGMRATDLTTAAVMTCVLVATAVLATVVPARRASRVDVSEALRQD